MRRHLMRGGRLRVSRLAPTYEPGAKHWRWGLESCWKSPHLGFVRICCVYLGRPRPDLRRGRGSFTLEAKTWRADLRRPAGPGSGVSRKMFARFKIGMG
jgi:hypothetical protein